MKMASTREAVMMKSSWLRLMGARGSATNTLFSDQIYPHTKDRAPNYGKVFTKSPLEEIARHRLVFLGEIHSMPPIISFQQQVQHEMQKRSTQLHVVMEHFSFELQPFLDQYSQAKITFDQLVQKYHEIGEEGHHLEPYKGLLEDAKAKGVRLHAGFIPRSYAKKFIKESPEEVLKDLSKWLKQPVVGLEGSEFHYNVFESLISGRFLYDKESSIKPTDQFRRIFKAQVLKDVAMANKVSQLIAEASTTKHDDEKGGEKFLVTAGNGHFLHYCGVPERVLDQNPEIADESCLVVSASSEEELKDEQDLIGELESRYGEVGSNPADYVLFYKMPEEENELDVKEETRRAYDKVGESAALPGNSLKAAWIMYNMGYSEEQYKAAGPDVYNFQGVGNPHLLANIQSGERVLDVGSGLGIDSFIASHSAGPDGEVIGIDISSKEVKHAQTRAQAYGLQKTKFMVADMENIPLPDDHFDVIISNGAFCLAPNKKRAFEELFRVLKPGGRISVCTTTTKMDNLEPGVSWPLCMRMFVAQRDLKPMCEEIGFENVIVDDSDSAMSMEIPEEVLKESNPDRNKVHVGGDDFKHLENYDMDRICARVCVSAFKPILSAAFPRDLFPRSR
jgi:arsenite methyltransferase